MKIENIIPHTQIAKTLKSNYNVITMKLKVIKIGNSRGIRIPKYLLEEAKIGTSVSIRMVQNKLVVSPIRERKNPIVNPEALLSQDALSDWFSPEEDEAWKDL